MRQTNAFFRCYFTFSSISFDSIDRLFVRSVGWLVRWYAADVAASLVSNKAFLHRFARYIPFFRCDIFHNRKFPLLPNANAIEILFLEALATESPDTTNRSEEAERKKKIAKKQSSVRSIRCSMYTMHACFTCLSFQPFPSGRIWSMHLYARSHFPLSLCWIAITNNRSKLIGKSRGKTQAMENRKEQNGSAAKSTITTKVCDPDILCNWIHGTTNKKLPKTKDEKTKRWNNRKKTGMLVSHGVSSTKQTLSLD